MNLIDTYYHWKNLVDLMNKVTASNMYSLTKTQKQKDITISHFTITFQNFAVKTEIGWVTGMAMPILKTRSVNDDAC